MSICNSLRHVKASKLSHDAAGFVLMELITQLFKTYSV